MASKSLTTALNYTMLNGYEAHQFACSGQAIEKSPFMDFHTHCRSIQRILYPELINDTMFRVLGLQYIVSRMRKDNKPCSLLPIQYNTQNKSNL